MEETLASKQTAIETRLALIERDIHYIDGLFDKLDITIDKLQKLTDSLNRLIIVHDSKLLGVNKEIEDLNKKFSALELLVNGFNRAKWLVLGGVAVVGYLLSTIDPLKVLGLE